MLYKLAEEINEMYLQTDQASAANVMFGDLLQTHATQDTSSFLDYIGHNDSLLHYLPTRATPDDPPTEIWDSL